jgi:hypothetical protein
MNPRKWGALLAVDSNGHKPGSFGKAAWSTTTLYIGKGLAFFHPAHPSADCFYMRIGEHGNALMIHPLDT